MCMISVYICYFVSYSMLCAVCMDILFVCVHEVGLICGVANCGSPVPDNMVEIQAAAPSNPTSVLLRLVYTTPIDMSEAHVSDSLLLSMFSISPTPFKFPCP